MTYASPDVGTPTHLGVEVFAKENALELRHVPIAVRLPP
jgi:hypothetical protein